ncbi:F-box/kelch-repeat protein [Acorus gramineus]|uniref:F-box/kelch-repeat protein n=1 Tax=Acorus gramineus TaxID=55184 RepID=A0AAV9B5P3_ACOGR|nr:F-box/kelch-repeat protein [Acorus gramineus]
MSDDDADAGVGGRPIIITGPQDADYPYIPLLGNDDLALLILARLPLSDHPSLRLVSRRHRRLVSSGALYPLRRSLGLRGDPSVFLLAGGEPRWRSFDPRSRSPPRVLPVLPSDTCFASGDKESICAGTHLLVFGKEIAGLAVWRYELVPDRWARGPVMSDPRCLFGSANCGSFACVAGGIGEGPRLEVLNSVEMYCPETRSWTPLPRMTKRRKLCSGCFMDGRFYVIGGKDEHDQDLTCGEFFDFRRNVWTLVRDMIKDAQSATTIATSRSPPLLAVVDDELYKLEAETNLLKVYLKGGNCWRELGRVPVWADRSRGWGVAFKSLGDELLVMGSSMDGGGMVICMCKPDLVSGVLDWRVLGNGVGRREGPFVFNCSVMIA